MSSMQAGDTFIMGDGGHLWVVISDPAKHDGTFIIVNLKTTVPIRTCQQCGHTWAARLRDGKPIYPLKCPSRKCSNPWYWDKPRRGEKVTSVVKI